MKKYLVIGVMFLLGCSGESTVKNEVKAQLIDPDSAKFRNIHIFKNGNYCGEVNAKNSMGGYSGFVVFYKSEGRTYLTDDGDGLNLQCRWVESPLLEICDIKKHDIKNGAPAVLEEFEALGCPELMNKSSFKNY